MTSVPNAADRLNKRKLHTACGNGRLLVSLAREVPLE